MITKEESDRVIESLQQTARALARIGNVYDLEFLEETGRMLEYRIEWALERDGREPKAKH
jgi:hypothetical protein